jgi:D-galactarolactone cycloisomerase
MPPCPASAASPSSASNTCSRRRRPTACRAAAAIAGQGGLVEVETDQGVKGIGEAFGNPFVTREYFRMIEPLFAGQSVFDFDHIEARIRNSMYHLGVGNQLTSCLAAINVALFDAIARGFGVRLCDLIGGCGTARIPAYASTGFFSDDPDRQLSHMLAEAAGHPYAGAKIKIGRGIRSDVERVRQSREALGPDKLLLVDINGAYTPDVALDCARAIEPFGIHWIEEPLPPGDLRGYAELRARSPIAIAAGEAHHTVRDFRALIDGPLPRHRAAVDPGRRRADRGQGASPPWRRRRISGSRRMSGAARSGSPPPAISSPRCPPRRIRRIRRGRPCWNTT